jgi:serine/threonine-protein kinase SRPK3
MKVQKSARHYTDAARDEIELLECATNAVIQEGFTESRVVRLIDSFEHIGPNGKRKNIYCNKSNWIYIY